MNRPRTGDPFITTSEPGYDEVKLAFWDYIGKMGKVSKLMEASRTAIATNESRRHHSETEAAMLDAFDARRSLTDVMQGSGVETLIDVRTGYQASVIGRELVDVWRAER